VIGTPKRADRVSPYDVDLALRAMEAAHKRDWRMFWLGALFGFSVAALALAAWGLL